MGVEELEMLRGGPAGREDGLANGELILLGMLLVSAEAEEGRWGCGDKSSFLSAIVLALACSSAVSFCTVIDGDDSVPRFVGWLCGAPDSR